MCFYQPWRRYYSLNLARGCGAPHTPPRCWHLGSKKKDSNECRVGLWVLALRSAPLCLPTPRFCELCPDSVFHYLLFFLLQQTSQESPKKEGFALF